MYVNIYQLLFSVYEFGTTLVFLQESQHLNLNLTPNVATTKTVTLKYEYGVYINLYSNSNSINASRKSIERRGKTFKLIRQKT